MLVGVVAANATGVNALFFYLGAYALMNLAAFAVITLRERQSGFGDDIRSMQGLGKERPVMAWILTIAMLALAGLPGTAGFIGKLYLIESAVDADYTWLGVAIVVGTMISLAYYLRVIAAIWMRPTYETDDFEAIRPSGLPAIAGGSQDSDPADVASATAGLGAAPDQQRGGRPSFVILGSAARGSGRRRVLRHHPVAARRLRHARRRRDRGDARLAGRRPVRHLTEVSNRWR